MYDVSGRPDLAHGVLGAAVMIQMYSFAHATVTLMAR
jgi:hypothetical protein